MGKGGERERDVYEPHPTDEIPLNAGEGRTTRFLWPRALSGTSSLLPLCDNLVNWRKEESNNVRITLSPSLSPSLAGRQHLRFLSAELR